MDATLEMPLIDPACSIEFFAEPVDQCASASRGDRYVSSEFHPQAKGEIYDPGIPQSNPCPHFEPCPRRWHSQWRSKHSDFPGRGSAELFKSPSFSSLDNYHY